MLFFSVIVLFSFSPVYSIIVDSNHTGIVSWISVKQNQESNGNLQTKYQTNGPVLQTVKRPGNVPTPYNYPSTQNVNTITRKPPPVYEYHPSPEVNYQHPQTFHGAMQNAQNKHINNLAQQASGYRQITYNPKWKEIYASSSPTTRYTVIHANGTVEHIDELHTIAARHPNYVLIKSEDILNQKYPASLNPQNRNNLESKKPVNPVPNLSKPSDSHLTVMRQILPKHENRKASQTYGKVVAGNPLPIYPNPSIPLRSSKFYGSAAATVAEQPAKQPIQQPIPQNKEIHIKLPVTTTNQGVLSYNLSPMNSINTAYSQSNNLSTKQPTIKVQIPNEVPQQDILPLILPQAQTSNTAREIETPSAVQNINKNEEITTINESNTPKATKESGTNTSINLTSLSDSLNVTNFKEITDVNKDNNTNNINNTNATKINNVNCSSTVQTVPDVTSKPEPPFTWFELKNDSLWDYIKNNKNQNVYFFFIPPEPKISKETKSTVFPNGTIIEEVIETELSSQDGEPKVKKTISVIHGKKL